MSCCTNTYDLGCHSQCDLLELTDIQWPSTGTFCFVSTFAGNPVSWEQDGVNGENIELSMQYLNEDGESTFYIKDSTGQILTFDISGTEYDCFKITAYPAGCGTEFTPTSIQTCSSVPVGNEGDIWIWDYASQEAIRYSPGTSGHVLTSNGAGQKPTYQASGGGGATDLAIANRTATTLDVTSSTGTDATVPQATTTQAGLLIATDKVKLNNTSGTNTGDQTLPVTGSGLQGTSTFKLGDITENTNLWQAAFRHLIGGVPEAGKQFEYDSGPDLFKLNAHHGLPAINGAGMRYMITFDGTPVTGYPLGKPTSWFFVKASNDTPVGGDYLVSIGFFDVLTGKETFWEVTEDALRGVLITAGGDETSVYMNDTEGLVARGKDDTGSNHAFTAKDVNDVRVFRVRNNGLIDIAGGGTIDPTAGNNGDVLTDDGSGNWSMQPPTGGAAGKIIWASSKSTIVSAVGSGYSFATPTYLDSLEIPLGTIGVQAGDIIHVRASGRRTGTGNSHQIFEMSNNSVGPSATERYGGHGVLNNSLGVNYMTYLYANGDFYDPFGSASTSAFAGDTYANNNVGSGGFTQGTAGSGQIDYNSSIWLHCWGIAANTCTLYMMDMYVEIIRP